jgi:hypothetical protein
LTIVDGNAGIVVGLRSAVLSFSSPYVAVGGVGTREDNGRDDRTFARAIIDSEQAVGKRAFSVPAKAGSSPRVKMGVLMILQMMDTVGYLRRYGSRI